MPSSLHAKESLLSGDSPLGDAREGLHVRLTSPSGLEDVQEQDALELLGNFGKRPRWLAPSHIGLGETHLFDYGGPPVGRFCHASIVECGPRSCLWAFLFPIAHFISTHCLSRSTFVFAPRSSTFFTPAVSTNPREEFIRALRQLPHSFERQQTHRATPCFAQFRDNLFCAFVFV